MDNAVADFADNFEHVENGVVHPTVVVVVLAADEVWSVRECLGAVASINFGPGMKSSRPMSAGRHAYVTGHEAEPVGMLVLPGCPAVLKGNGKDILRVLRARKFFFVAFIPVNGGEVWVEVLGSSSE